MSDHRNADRIAGAALIATAASSVLVMAHHPTSAHAGSLGAIVHGAMIVLLAATAFGFAHFAIRRGLDRPAILAGLVAYALCAFGHVGAATIGGFVVPAVAARGHDAASQGVIGHDIFLLAWESNQALARLGVYANAAAFLLWSLDFLRRPGLEARLIGILGLAAGAVPAILLATGTIRMNVPGALTAYTVFAAWAALVGLHLLRGRLDRDQPAEAQST